ncbi:unnamed protein product [Colletotrichum noveboracense]|uniref:Uncharacterized protein n=1 Tax=Colletotrichum noveboracense TaxID=2664923 RepID=A0A9W4S5S8_9PEZI|nr:unnamed protein product [Colletotrichum noveboracense]
MHPISSEVYSAQQSCLARASSPAGVQGASTANRSAPANRPSSRISLWIAGLPGLAPMMETPSGGSISWPFMPTTMVLIFRLMSACGFTICLARGTAPMMMMMKKKMMGMVEGGGARMRPGVGWRGYLLITKAIVAGLQTLQLTIRLMQLATARYLGRAIGCRSLCKSYIAASDWRILQQSYMLSLYILIVFYLVYRNMSSSWPPTFLDLLFAAMKGNMSDWNEGADVLLFSYF